MAGDGLAAAHGPDMLSGLGLDVDRRLGEPEQAGQVGSMVALCGPSFGSWAWTITSQLTDNPARRES